MPCFCRGASADCPGPGRCFHAMSRRILLRGSGSAGSNFSPAAAGAVAMGEPLQFLNRRWQDRGFPLIDIWAGLSTGDVADLCVGRTAPQKFATRGEVVRCAGQLVRCPHEPDDPVLCPGSCRILIGADAAAYLDGRFWLHQIQTRTSGDEHLATVEYRVYGKHDRLVLNKEGDLRLSTCVEIMTPVTVAHGTCAMGLTSNIGVGGHGGVPADPVLADRSNDSVAIRYSWPCQKY